MNKPAKLLEFFKASYDKGTQRIFQEISHNLKLIKCTGGVVSLLSLKSIFLLITKHNL